MSLPLLVVAGVTKRYGSFCLGTISFRVEEGEIFGVFGPHEAGKTVLLSVLSGQNTPDQGTISLQGVNVHRKERQARALFGLVPQRADINVPDGQPTPRQLLAFEASLQGITQKYREERIVEALEQTGLRHVEHLHITAFSTGMHKRLALARALLHRPRLLFLDGLTEQVGNEEQRLLWRILLDLQEQGKTLVLASAKREEVTTLCNRYVTLQGGVLQGEETVNV